MKITELVLQTDKLSGLYHFYRSVLELKVVPVGNDRIELYTPGTKLSFIKSAEGTNPYYHFAFNIPSNKIAEAYEGLHNKIGLSWIDEYHSYIADFVNWHAKSLYFADPAGNIVELIARFDLNDNVDEKFSAELFRNVSEIGLVFPSGHFDESVENFRQQYQLVYFDKQPPLPQFRAIGNDDGLFIVVPQDRFWFPTKHIKSGIFPMQVSFATDHGKHTIQL